MVRLLAIILFCCSFVFSESVSIQNISVSGNYHSSFNQTYYGDTVEAMASSNGTSATVGIAVPGKYYLTGPTTFNSNLSPLTQTFNGEGKTFTATFYWGANQTTVKVRYTVSNTYSQSVAFYTVSGSPPASFSVAGGASGSGDCTFSWTGDAPVPFSLVLFGGGFVVATTSLDLSQYQDGDIIPVGVTYGNIGSSGEQEIPPGNPPPELPPANPPGIPENPPVIEEPGQPEIFQHIAGDEIESIKNGTNPTFGAFDAGTMDFGDVVSQLMTSASGFISCINNFNSKMGEILHKVRTLYIPSVNDRVYRFPFMAYKGETYYMDLTYCSWLFEKMRTMFRYAIYLLFMWQLFLIVRYLIGGK